MQTVFLPLDFGAALFDLLVRLAAQTVDLILGFDQRLFLAGLCLFLGILQDTLGFRLGRADSGFGHLLAMLDTGTIGDESRYQRADDQCTDSHQDGVQQFNHGYTSTFCYVFVTVR